MFLNFYFYQKFILKAIFFNNCLFDRVFFIKFKFLYIEIHLQVTHFYFLSSEDYFPKIN